MHMCCIYWNIRLQFFSLITSKMVSALTISIALPCCTVSYPLHSNLRMYEVVQKVKTVCANTYTVSHSTIQHVVQAGIQVIFHLFPRLKEFLGGRHFESDEEVKDVVPQWLNGLAAEVCADGIQKLVTCCDNV